MLDQIINEFLDSTSFPTIIEFVESKWGMNERLLPVQKFILKLIYGLPLDSKERNIEITDKFREHIFEKLNEVEYFKFLQAEERINLNDPPTKPFFRVVEAIGRRGSKSTMASFISAYEVLRLLTLIKDPHSYFSITKTDEIRITVISSATSQADLVFNQIKEACVNCDRIKKFITHNNDETIRFMTPGQMDRYKQDSSIPLKDRKGLLSAFVGVSNSRSSRGPGSIVIILDEFAHFVTNSGVRSDTAVYEAIAPSMSAFGSQGKLIAMSSPLAKQGKFYDLYKQGMYDKYQDLLVLRIPTWGINPVVKTDYLRSQYIDLGKVSYNCEYGAVFSDAKHGWMEDESLITSSLITDKPQPNIGKRYVRYYWAIDMAQKSDAFALAVSHRENDTVITDYKIDYYGNTDERNLIRRMGFNPRDKYQYTNKPIRYPQDYEDIVAEMKEVAKIFPISKGIIDQFSGVLLKQVLDKNGLKNIEIVNFTDGLNSQVYDLWRLVMHLGQYQIYDDPYFVNQILMLEEEIRGRNIRIVSAPNRKGCHDDLADAVARSVWLTLTSAKDGSIRSSDHRGMGAHIGMSSVSYNAYHQQKFRLHNTGFDRRMYR